MATMTHLDNIAVLHLGDGENRFCASRIDNIHACLDDVSPHARGLVTIGGGRFYSNGLEQGGPCSHTDQSAGLVTALEKLLNRTLTFPLPTVAAVNGHAFGAGAMFALAHDYRVMREDHGYFCFPEVDLNVPFTRGMAALIQAKLSAKSAHAAMTTGRRYGGPAALDIGLVGATPSKESLFQVAVGQLREPVSGKRPDTLTAIKSAIYELVTAALLAKTPRPESESELVR